MKIRIARSCRLIDALKQHADSSCSARAIKRALESNVCRVNGRIERFASAVLQAGDQIELVDGWESFDSKSRGSISILYEDADLMIINKPANTVCTDSHLSQLMKRSLFLAHRLDKDTTGVLLLGKSRAVAEELQACFEQRIVEKEYLALVDGQVKEAQGKMQSHFIKKGSFQGQTLWGSNPAGMGLFAETSWRRLKVGPDFTLLQCTPTTGRTHQIRVHLAEMGHPILVDRQYATSFRSSIFSARPLLHAHKLQFEWRSRPIAMEAPLPEDFHALSHC